MHKLLEKDAETLRGVCAECGPVELIWKRRGDRRTLRCKLAVRTQAKNAPSYGGHNWKQPHGLTMAQARKAKEIAGACEICGEEARIDGPGGLVIDHCHDTLVRRGVLCSNCNTGIGLLKHDPELLRAAADYLDNPPGVKVVIEPSTANPQAKLTDAQMRGIRASVLVDQNGKKIPQRELAEHFGVTASRVCQIRNGVVAAHLLNSVAA